VVGSAVNRNIDGYKSGAILRNPPAVVNVDGSWLVHYGNNRVYAAKAAGLTEIDVIDVTPQDRELIKIFQARLRRAKLAEQHGFENVPIDDTFEQRALQGKPSPIRRLDAHFANIVIGAVFGRRRWIDCLHKIDQVLRGYVNV
jgi:hypothetical protein